MIIHKELGMPTVFKPKSKFKTELYREIDNIRYKYNEYHNDFLKLFDDIRKHFPFLSINNFPYANPHKTISLSGILITKELSDECLLTTEDELLQFGLKVFIVIPYDFKKTGIKVFDYFNVIDFESIPYEYRHYRYTQRENLSICTHHKDFIKSEDPILSVLKSAWHLFVEYKKYERTGKFNLSCLSHNYRGSGNNF
jgi:hypothetical protein